MRERAGRSTAVAVWFLGLIAACSSRTPTGDAGDFDANQAAARADASATRAGTAGANSTVPAPRAAPTASQPLASDFTATELGGYKLGAQLTGDSSDLPPDALARDAAHCSILTAIVRDFRGAAEAEGHPDFEVFDGKGPTVSLLGATLGGDHKPEYASQCEASPDKRACPYGQMTTSASAFATWYRNEDGTNLSYRLELAFAADREVYTFQSKNFFPLDGNGFGNSPVGKRKHNFSFTTELHTRFVYHGGETFGFTGDDDLWVFINGRLAIDLGGLHPPESARVDLDEAAERLELTRGEEYPLELFHAERHSANSNFRVDTTIEFTECGRVFTGLM